MMAYMDTDFKKIHFFSYRNEQMPKEKKDMLEWTTEIKTTLIQKDPPKEPYKRLQTHNMARDNVKNTNSTN